MANRTLRVDYIARVEGESSLDLRIRDGKVERVRLSIFEPPRFFEALLRGRGFGEVLDIVARICGICPIAYQMSGVHAIEDALGIVVDPPIRVAAPAPLLRRVDREPRAAHRDAARPRLSRLSRRHRDGPRPPRRRAARARAQKGRQRTADLARRPRDPSGERKGRRVLSGAEPPRVRARWWNR